jgi:Mn-dependent DtxR family transcriptional regulator
MQDITGLELSPRKIEYLKYLLEKGYRVRTTEISSKLKVDPSTTTKTLNDLSGSGYVDHIPYRGVSLTKKGREYAEFLVKRHRILSLMLSHFGINADEACEEVSRFEGHVSKNLIDNICASMGHPTMSNCGEIKHDTCLHGCEKPKYINLE